jgi:hypothetical protein
MRLQSLVRPLGWFSLALGAAELLFPRKIAAAHGAPRSQNLVRGFGAREIAAGLGVLAKPRSSVPLWARAVGDVMDGGAAALAARRAQGRPRKVSLASLATVLGFFALDVMVARSTGKRRP